MRMILILLAGFLLFRGLDIYQTYFFVTSAGMLEDNPIALWVFQKAGVWGMVAWSSIWTIALVGFVLYLQKAYVNTDRVFYARQCAYFVATLAIGLTFLTTLQWKAYGEVDIDINNYSMVSDNFIATQPQPLPQVAVYDSIKGKKAPVVHQLGHPDNFAWLGMDKIRVKISYMCWETREVKFVLASDMAK